MKMQIAINGAVYEWDVDAVEIPGTDLEPGYLSPHFRASEFTCNHCNSMDGHVVPQSLLYVLEDVRSNFGDAPVSLSNGYRCPTHNQNVGGAVNSQHLYPENSGAADISVSGISAQAVYDYLDTKYAGKYGVGKYPTFTHVDVRPGPSRW